MADSASMLGQGADALRPTNRNFYENVLFKAVLSIVYFACALMFLGFCSEAGGKSASSKEMSNLSGISSYQKDYFGDIQSGFGFASFCYFTSFALCVAACFQISPISCGYVKFVSFFFD